MHPGTAPYLLLHAYSFRHIGGKACLLDTHFSVRYATSRPKGPENTGAQRGVFGFGSRREAWYDPPPRRQTWRTNVFLMGCNIPYVWYRGSFVDLSRRLRLGRFAPFRFASPTQTSTPAVKKTAFAQDDRCGWRLRWALGRVVEAPTPTVCAFLHA